MTNKECASTLKKFNAWRRGKGKKYAQPGIPFDPKVIGECIDQAVGVLANAIDNQPLVNVIAAASTELEYLKRHRKDIAKSLNGDEKKKFAKNIVELAASIRKVTAFSKKV